MTGRTKVRIRRVYEEARPREDGLRVLVDRLWPRGMKKEDARLDEWVKEVAPSSELRKWYGHDPELFEEFAERYRAELSESGPRGALADLRKRAAGGTLTLLTSVKAEQLERSHAAVLAEELGGSR
ncbi:DUF488 domain-containing protein [Streptomyces albidus (ex Kaewkla and Franco 2022)]|uniref:DUF488 domain-containing protein n=1 Tax=Streptomyces albidus (ex Kaewkla and Franco 2022) TaxID=722709 RepID=UPI0015EFAC60|nr:DUF488 family protein [Streptomyces albidus (ex Kaewkla and Franco 2022)]